MDVAFASPPQFTPAVAYGKAHRHECIAGPRNVPAAPHCPTAPPGNARSVIANATNVAIVNSRITEIHTQAPATGSGAKEAQGIAAWNTGGPIRIKNNYITASAQGALFGGSASCALDGTLVPSDIEVLNNHFHKPLSWKPDFACVTSMGNGDRWWVKNHLEFKAGIRVRVDGNYFENSWGLLYNCSDQNGGALGMSPRSEADPRQCTEANPWSRVTDATWAHNWVFNAGQGITIIADDEKQLSGQTSCVWIENNVIYGAGSNDNMSPDPQKWGPGRLFAVTTGTNHGVAGLWIRHNTGLQNAATVFVKSLNGPKAADPFIFENNITKWNVNNDSPTLHGIQGKDGPTDTTYGEGIFTNGGQLTSTYQAFFPNSAAYFRRNLMLHTTGDLNMTYGTSTMTSDLTYVAYSVNEASTTTAPFDSMKLLHLDSQSTYNNFCSDSWPNKPHPLGPWEWDATGSSVGLDLAGKAASFAPMCNPCTRPSATVGIRDGDSDT